MTRDYTIDGEWSPEKVAEFSNLYDSNQVRETLDRNDITSDDYPLDFDQGEDDFLAIANAVERQIDNGNYDKAALGAVLALDNLPNVFKIPEVYEERAEGYKQFSDSPFDQDNAMKKSKYVKRMAMEIADKLIMPGLGHIQEESGALEECLERPGSKDVPSREQVQASWEQTASLLQETR